MPFLTGIFMWFERPENAWARYAIMIALALVGLKAWGSWKEQQGRDKQRQADAITTIKTIKKIEEKSDVLIKQADAIVAANPVSVSDDRMSDQSLADYNYRDP